MSAEAAANLLWLIWYVTWIGAVVWSAKTEIQMNTDMAGAHRFCIALGVLLLFLPSGSGRPVFGLAFLGWCTQKLWREPSWAAWGLFALIAAGFGFCWWARSHLGRLWSGLVTLKEGHRVIDTGPYRLVRHPIYSGVMFAAFATALLRASPASLVGFALITIGFSMTARIEEGFLREQLDDYDAYSRKVPMLVPTIR
jgi:protein-S-isoprenylcysteine O-methyltransferase Ste14